MQHVIPSTLTWNPQAIASSEVGFKPSFRQCFVSVEKHSHSVGGWKHILYWARSCVHSCSKGKQENRWGDLLGLERNISIFSVPSNVYILLHSGHCFLEANFSNDLFQYYLRFLWLYNLLTNYSTFSSWLAPLLFKLMLSQKNGYLDASKDCYETVENMVSLNNFIQTYLTFFVSGIIHLIWRMD